MRSPNLIDWLEDRAIRLEQISSTEQPAYVFLQGDSFKRQDLSHRDLLIRAKSLAAFIQSRASLGDRAILLYPSGLDYIVAFFACLYAGVIAVPAFPPSTRRRDWGRIDTIFNNADPALVLTTGALCENINQWQQERPAHRDATVVATDDLNGSDAALWQRPPCSADSVAFLQYSSGSTGTPKGVMVTHANIRHNLQVIADGFDLSSRDRGASWLPIYHDMGLIGSVMEPFNLSLSIYLMSPLDVLQKPARWLQAITDFRVTASGGPNFIYEHCVNRIKENEKASLDLSAWQLAFNGSEPVSRDTMERFARAFESSGFQSSAFTPCYGMAETTLMVSSCARGELVSSIDSQDTPANTSLVCSGNIHPDFRVKIVNPDTHVECTDGQTGEIWVQGTSVASGYWQQNELSEQTFRARLIGDDSHYLRTGDLGIKLGQSLYVTGRIKELIIIRGQNHYPQDIEALVAQSCEALSGCSGAAFSVAVDGAEQLVVVHEINRRFLRDFDGEKILASVRRAVAETHQLQIHGLVLIRPASLLRTTSGKVRRVAMREAFLNDELSVVYRWSAGETTNEEQKDPRKTSVSAEVNFPGVAESELQDTLQWLRDYAERRINSRLIDERRSIPPYIVLDMGNKGLMGLHVAKEEGGLAYSYQQAMRVYQQLGAIDPSLALFVGLGNVLGLRPVQRFASATVKGTYLRDLARGRVLAAFAITEPGAGSNPLAINTTAVRGSDGRFTLNGCKVWSGSAAWASVIHVFAKTFDEQGNALGVTGFAVEQGLPGLTIGAEALTMGMRGTCQSRVELDNVRVPTHAVLGQVGEGMEVAQDAMKFGRLVITAAAVGGMKRCAQLMARYARRRQVGTGLLLDNPITLQRLQDLQHAIIAVESLVHRVARCLDQGLEVPIEYYVACKISGPEYFWQAADRLVQLLGGRGYIENNIAPQLLRDARVLRIFEGPTETLGMYFGARVHKATDDFFSFLNEQLGARTLADELRSDLDELATRCRNSRGFAKAMDAERWLHERSGRLAVLLTLKATLPEQEIQTRQWLDSQYQTILDAAYRHLDSGIRAESTVLLEAIESYSADIGDIEQGAAGEDHGLDDYLKRQVTPAENKVAGTETGDLSFRLESNRRQQEQSSQGDETTLALNTWMRHWIARRLQLSPDEVNTTQEFVSFGLDSVDAVELTHELGTEFSMTVKPDLAWVYPNISSASEYLVTLLDDRALEPVAAVARPEEKWLEGDI